MTEPVHLWVVDDDHAVRFVLATALRDAGYAVSAYGNAADAMQALRHTPPPALVVTDVRMPGDSGLQLLEQLKAAHPQVPVIVMSAYTDVASTAGAFRGGAHEFLSKPFDLNEAVALVRRALPQQAPPAPSAAICWWAMRRRCARCFAPLAGWRRCHCRFWSPAKPAPAKSW